MNILVTGANGFVGQALIEQLLKSGHQIFALVRSMPLNPKNNIKYLIGDLLKPDSLPSLEPIERAFYLVHGLKGPHADFEYQESTAAINFLKWIKPQNPQIIYLGGLAPNDETLSAHLRARVLTGQILGVSTLPVLEFRASIILGANSLSFEMIKAMCERLPFRPEINLLDRPCQPLSQVDLLNYLEEAISTPVLGHQIVEIGGPEVTTYGELMDLYSQLAGLKRKKVKLPEVEKRVLMKALDYVVPEYAEIGKKLTESLDHKTVVTSSKAAEMFPKIKPLGLKSSMQKAKEQSQTHYPSLWEKDFLKGLLSDKLLTQSGLISPDLLRHLEKVGKIKDILTRKSHD